MPNLVQNAKLSIPARQMGISTQAIEYLARKDLMAIERKLNQIRTVTIKSGTLSQRWNKT
jgi:hypothetical protein